MEERRNGKVLAIVALLVAVAGLSLGYAALSTTLTINGSATVQTSSWDVHFVAVASQTETSNVLGFTSTASAGTFNLTTTSISNASATLKTPGDTVKYHFSVTNGGSYAARLGSISDLTAVTLGGAAADTAKVAGLVTYTLQYDTGDTDAGETVTTSNSNLAAGATRKMVLTITFVTSAQYNNDTTFNATKLPAAAVTATLPEITLVYQQA